jgi:hypothetical protein
LQNQQDYGGIMSNNMALYLGGIGETCDFRDILLRLLKQEYFVKGGTRKMNKLFALAAMLLPPIAEGMADLLPNTETGKRIIDEQLLPAGSSRFNIRRVPRGDVRPLGVNTRIEEQSQAPLLRPSRFTVRVCQKKKSLAEAVKQAKEDEWLGMLFNELVSGNSATLSEKDAQATKEESQLPSLRSSGFTAHPCRKDDSPIEDVKQSTNGCLLTFSNGFEFDNLLTLPGKSAQPTIASVHQPSAVSSRFRIERIPLRRK